MPVPRRSTEPDRPRHRRVHPTHWLLSTQVANKIDIDYQVTRKNFKFASSKNIPFYFVSAADGTNVVKVFRAAVESALDYKDNSGDFMNEAYKLLDDA